MRYEYQGNPSLKRGVLLAKDLITWLYRAKAGHW
jgi:hypothetical protein